MKQYLVTRRFDRYFVGQWISLSDADAHAERLNITPRETYAPTAPAPITTAAALAALDVVAQAKEAAGILFQAQAATVPSLLPTDTSSQGKLLSAFVAAGAGLWVDGTYWKMADSATFVPFTKMDVEVAAQAALAYVAGCASAQARIAALLVADPALDIAASPMWPGNGPFVAPRAAPKAAADGVAFDVAEAVETNPVRADAVMFKVQAATAGG